VEHGIRFAFDEVKAAQAAGRLLRRHGRQMHGARLVKLLYLADRRNFVETGIPITGDDFISAEDGPALRNILRLIAGEEVPGRAAWDRHVQRAHGSYLAGSADRGDGDLHGASIKRLDAVYDQHGNSELPLLCLYARQLPEWCGAQSAGGEIDPYVILRGEGFTPEMICDVEERADAVYSLEAALRA